MRYSIDDLVLFEPLLDPSARDGTSYFELHPAELPQPHACWLPGSMFLRDAAFDFFAECFHSASDSFDYFASVRFGPHEISRLVVELSAFVASLETATPARDRVFAKYASLFTPDIWSGVATRPLATRVSRAGEQLRAFVQTNTGDSKCLWVLGM